MTRNRIILLVEDNPDDAELTIMAFERAKVANEIVVVRDGAEALDYLFVRGTHATRDATITPELVLLDLNLPKIGGLDVLRQLRGDPRTKSLPVVILTSSKEERDLIAGYDLGANSFVRKPVDFTEFTKAAEHLGMYWLVLNQPPPTR